LPRAAPDPMDLRVDLRRHLPHQVDDLEKVRLPPQDVAMARHDDLWIESLDLLQRRGQLRWIATREVGHRMIDQVARDQDLFLGDEDHRVSGGVPAAEEPDLHEAVAQIDLELTVKDQGRGEIAHPARERTELRGHGRAARDRLPKLLLLAVAQALAVVVRALGESLSEELAPARIPLEPSGVVSFDLLPRLRLRDDAQPGKRVEV